MNVKLNVTEHELAYRVLPVGNWEVTTTRLLAFTIACAPCINMLCRYGMRTYLRPVREQHSLEHGGSRGFGGLLLQRPHAAQSLNAGPQHLTALRSGGVTLPGGPQFRLTSVSNYRDSPSLWSRKIKKESV